MNINQLFTEELKDKLIKQTVEFLKIPSELDENSTTTPYGEEIKKALDYILEIGKEEGFETLNVRDHAGHIEFGEGEEVLGMLCHVDVVPVNKPLWDTDPYNPVIKDDKIYARGATDDKGPVLAVLYAMKILKDAGFKPNKKVRLILGCDEETGMRGVAEYLKDQKTPDIGFSPDASYPLIYGEKGISRFDIKGQASSNIVSFKAGKRVNVIPDYAELKLRDSNLKSSYEEFIKKNNYDGEVKMDGELEILICRGKSGHAMNPKSGFNAINPIIEFMKDNTDDKFIKFAANYIMFDETAKKFGLEFEQKDWGISSLNVGILNYEAGEWLIGCDFRYPKDFNFNFEINKIKDLCKQNDLTFDLNTHKEPHHVPLESDLVQSLMSAYRKHTGDLESQPFTIGGGTYSRVLPKCVAFGPEMPNRQTNIHQPNENIHIDDLYKSVLIYAESIYNLTK